MKLYLMRHGEAVSEHENLKRPLSVLGKELIVQFGQTLQKAQNCHIVQIWHSGKLRTQQTAEIIAPFIAPNARIQLQRGLLPNDSVEDFLIHIELLKKETLIVGHLPFLGILSKILLGKRYLFSPGKILCLENKTGPWVLDWEASP